MFEWIKEIFFFFLIFGHFYDFFLRIFFPATKFLIFFVIFFCHDF